MDQDKPLFRDDAEGLFQEEGRDNWREEVFQIYWPASSSHDSEKCEELASLSEGFFRDPQEAVEAHEQKTEGRVPWSGVAGEASVRSGMAGPISPPRAVR